VQRPLVLVSMLFLVLGPTTGLAQDQTPVSGVCPVFGHFQDVYQESRNSSVVLVRYEFEFPAKSYLPFDEYPETMLVAVTEGTFRLTVEESRGRGQADDRLPAVVVVRGGGPAGSDEGFVSPDREMMLGPGDVIFQQKARYQYENVGEDTAYLSVSVLIPRGRYTAAMASGRIDHAQVCAWCIAFGEGAPRADDEDTGRTSLTAAKRLPAIQCRGG